MATLIQNMRYVLAQKDPLLPNETKRVILKELLQAYTLDFLYNHPIYRKLHFYGGTCLHVVFGLNRLSEDIDLDNSNGIDITNLKDDLLSFYQSRIGYPDLSAKTQIGERGIHRITLKFSILNALGLTSHSNEPLHLKVEVSPHKQISVVQMTPVMLYGRSFVAAHFSLETMMAGKMLACLERDFRKGQEIVVKGRDFYDLLWFMQKRVVPLEKKLAADGNVPYTVNSAMIKLREKVDHMRITDLAQDLLPLFEERVYIEAWLEGFKDNYKEYARFYE